MAASAAVRWASQRAVGVGGGGGGGRASVQLASPPESMLTCSVSRCPTTSKFAAIESGKSPARDVTAAGAGAGVEAAVMWW